MVKEWKLSSGVIRLERIPGLENDSFQAWDAADEYILSENCEAVHTLVLNDNWGALAAALPGKVTVYTDSFVSGRSIFHNCRLNKREGVKLIHSLNEIPCDVDRVIIRLPKSLPLLEYQLQKVTERCTCDITGAGMVKYMPMSAVRLFEHYLSDVHTSLAKKKARLIYGKAQGGAEPQNTYPFIYTADNKIQCVNYPGVFSMDHLDIGTRFFLEVLEKEFVNREGRAVDLGCGNGLVGASVKRSNPSLSFSCSDESHLAVLSAEETFKVNGFTGDFIVQDILGDTEPGSCDFILCNPPFHQNNRVLTDIARSMFRQSHKALKKGGEFWVVANRHLGYHKVLRSLFHNLQTVGENKKFFVFKAVKNRG